MKVIRTKEIDYIVECVMASWDQTCDDGSVARDLYFPDVSDNVIWLRVEDFGVFAFTKMNHILFEVHTILLPSAHGKSVDIAKAVVQWMWDNTCARRIITSVPEFNQLALRLAERVGFIRYGVNVKSFQKNGYLFDQTMLGINKENESCQ